MEIPSRVVTDWEEAWICDGTDRTLIEYLDHQEEQARYEKETHLGNITWEHTPQPLFVEGWNDEYASLMASEMRTLQREMKRELRMLDRDLFGQIAGLSGLLGGISNIFEGGLGAIGGAVRPRKKP